MMLHWSMSAAALPPCRLPSFTDKFQAKEPLTRIRDIAHRNDIPHDIKKEIKHTIQVRWSLTRFLRCGAAGSDKRPVRSFCMRCRAQLPWVSTEQQR